MEACACARRMCSIHAPVVGGSLSTPWSVFSCLNRYHLNSLAREIFILFGQKRVHKNFSQPSTTSGDGSSPRPRPFSAAITSGLEARKLVKHVVLPLTRMCPVVSQPVRACQLIRAADFSGPNAS